MEASRQGKDDGRSGNRLANNEEAFRLIVDGVKDYAIFMLDPQGHVTTWNAGAQRIKGYTAEEIIGQHFSRFYTPEDLASGKPPYELKVSSETGKYEEEGLRVRKDGSLFWASVLITALRDEQGHLRGFAKVTRDVTERKRGEQALRDSEARLRAVVETAVDGILAIDERGTIEWLNPAAEHVFGYAADELLGQNVKLLMPEPYLFEHDRYIANYLHTGERKIIGHGREVEGWRKDGSTFPVDLSVSEVWLGDRRIFTGIVRDISQRKKVERALRESEGHARRIIDNTLAFIGVLSLDGTLVEANATALRAGGLRREEVIGRKFWDCFWWSYDAHVQDRLREAVGAARKGQVIRYDVVVRIAGDKRMVIDFMLAPALDTDGRVTYLIPSGIDITERKRAEAALRDSEERFRATFEQAAVGIAQVSLDGRWLRVNQKLCDIVGHGRDELLAITFQDITHPDDLDADLHHVRGLIAGDIQTYSMEKRYVHRDGSAVWVNLTVSLVRDAVDEPSYFVSVVEDIRQRKEAEYGLVAAKEQAERSAREAEQANRAKDHFLAVLSHELRTPLTPVLATATFMEQRPDLPEELREEIGTIRRNIELEARLVDDLLDMTRISRGRIELHLEVVDLHSLVRAAVQTVQPEVEAKRLDLLLGLRATRHHVWADPARIQQVLINLLGNAAKFTPEGGMVTVRTDDDGELVIVEVGDTGVGIDPDVLPKLFNPFEQGERTVTRGRGGLGLGLAISKSFVDLHAGTLTASSEGRGKGAAFTLKLAAMPEATLLSNPVPPRQSGERGSCTILLVEDHEDTRRVMARLLKSFGCDVKTAATVSEALEVIEREQIDLLVSDIGLPDGTGHDVMHKAQQKGIRGIALSGFGQDEDIRRSRESGFDTHLVKPVNVQAMEEIVVGRMAPAPRGMR